MSLHLQVSGVPCWMFLGWVSQMTAILDKPESLAVHDLLVNIAQQYPQVVELLWYFIYFFISSDSSVTPVDIEACLYFLCFCIVL